MIELGLSKNMRNQFEDAIDTYRYALQLLDQHSTPDGRLRPAPWKALSGGIGVSTVLEELDVHLARAKIFQNIGNALCGLERYEEALKYFERAEEVAPPGSDWKSSPGPRC
jgi:tetratricopeptide (TPR) repeat protein